jgi:hypothetical protein
MEFIGRIVKIQNELKAPKGQYNSFGKYRYRSQEDILEAVKPLLAENGLLQTITDKVEFVGDTATGDGRFYVSATVRVTDGKTTVEVTGYAREAYSKKGMDDSQITGTASSYARKYALGGMWLIDDTKDADTMDNSAVELRDLRQDDPAFEKIVNRLASGKVTLDEVAKHYKLDATLRNKLIEEVKNLPFERV